MNFQQTKKTRQTRQTIIAWGLLGSIVSLIFFLGFFTHKAFAMSAKKPVEVVTPVVNPGVITPIENIVKASACFKHSWPGRGMPPTGYILGVARVYADQVCRGVVGKPLGSTDKDALAYYGIKSGDVLQNTYALLIGLGMRESSGKYCEGRDMSATNTSADTAEAGLFQTSWNSRSASPQLPKIFAAYKASSAKCDLDTFSKGVKCSASNLSNYGSGDGRDFQALSKSCPAFAVEYAAEGIRNIRRHWGPLSRKEAEFNLDCRNMLAIVAIEAKKSCPGPSK